MKLHTHTAEIWVKENLREVFHFFEQPENLEILTPPSMEMRTLTPRPIAMNAGAIFDYTLRVHGFPVRWTSAIAEYDPPHRFVDVQLKGPYAYWHHAHTFHEENGGTTIRDTVTYALPFGPLGSLVHWLFVRRDVQAIFAYRQREIERRFGV